MDRSWHCVKRKRQQPSIYTFKVNGWYRRSLWSYSVSVRGINKHERTWLCGFSVWQSRRSKYTDFTLHGSNYRAVIWMLWILPNFGNYTAKKRNVPPDHLLLDRSPDIRPLISRWELDKFKNCCNKSFRTSKILTLLYQQFSNLLISQQDMSGPRLGTLYNTRWSGAEVVHKPSRQGRQKTNVHLFILGPSHIFQITQVQIVPKYEMAQMNDFFLINQRSWFSYCFTLESTHYCIQLNSYKFKICHQHLRTLTWKHQCRWPWTALVMVSAQ